MTAWDPSLPLDARVPILPWSVYAYVSYYAYFPLLLVLGGRGERGRRELCAVAQGLAIVAAVSLATFAALPAEVDTRARVYAALGESAAAPTRALFAAIHAVDAPYNAWPSLHVSLTLVVLLYAVRRTRRWTLRAAGWIAWTAMALSVLTTGQHYLFDLASGAVLGALVWRLAVRPALERADQRP